MRPRHRVVVGFLASACLGTVVLTAVTAWLAWRESITTEETAVASLAMALGERTENIIKHTFDLLEELSEMPFEPCSEAHLEALDRVAFTEPEILAIGYWQAAERLCGGGFNQAIRLKPRSADRIYESGIIAWWPGPQTEVEGVQLFLMRFGRYDVALDPRVLLQAVPTRGRQVGLWVESLRMAAVPWEADLPSPSTLAPGLTLDRASGRILARFSLGELIPIDIVVAEPLGQLWRRYAYTIIITVVLLLVVSALWNLGVVFYLRRWLSLPAEMRRAATNGRLFAVYQPIVNLETGRCVGAEALARWNRETGEVMMPSLFIQMAQQAGLMRELTVAILDVTLAELALFLRGEPNAYISINLSRADLEDPTFVEELNRRLRKHRVAAGSLKLEITESALLGDETAAVIKTLRARGHRVAIDDFGTGYSSLSYLQTFDLDTLKIDKTFVDAIGTDAVTSPVIHHVIELATELDLDMVAEGVETEEQAAWLRAKGVACGQGYLFSRPLTARAFQEIYRTRQARQTATIYTLGPMVERTSGET